MYYFYLPSTGERSSIFDIAPNVYNIVGAVAMRSFFFQRCNEDRALPYASDAVGSFGGIGGRWVDGACHLGDLNCPAGPGSPDHGALELGGGWHDAGDYQKTLWGRGVDPMLWAFEINPGVWTDGQLNIPESGNGIPDILDELMWELDFYVKMQRPDGHFMSSVKGSEGTVASPPSASDEGRVYFDTTSPSGGGWSGGGVTLVTSTGNAVLALAHAAIVFEGIGETQIATRYRNAALSGWAWLDAAPASGGEHRLRIAAAAAVSRLQGAPASTRARLVDDVQTSTYGPAPGLVPGGPNASYSGSNEIPNKAFPAYAYRDWSVGCDWTGSACASSSWEVTEPMAAYQGPFVLLVSFMMSGN